MRVFKNPGNDNDWINVRLIGVKSNRAAVGAEIKVTVENDGGTRRSIYRTVGDTSSFGSKPDGAAHRTWSWCPHHQP